MSLYIHTSFRRFLRWESRCTGNGMKGMVQSCTSLYLRDLDWTQSLKRSSSHILQMLCQSNQGPKFSFTFLPVSQEVQQPVKAMHQKNVGNQAQKMAIQYFTDNGSLPWHTIRSIRHVTMLARKTHYSLCATSWVYTYIFPMPGHPSNKKVNHNMCKY